jgi:hypothetical protein
MQIKSRRMRWAGHAVLIGGGENCTRFCWESQNERDHSEEGGVDGRIALRVCDWGVWSGFSWLRIGTDGGLL